MQRLMLRLVFVSIFLCTPTTGEESGQKVRITLPEKQTVIGYIESVRLNASGVNELVVIEKGQVKRTIDVATIQKMERDAGRKHHFKTGATIGFVAGCVPVLIAALEKAPIALAATALGAGIGYVIRSDKWEKVQVESLARAGRPSPGMLAIQLSTRF